MTLSLRPSAAKFWTNCAAWPRMVANVPEQPEGDPAREGTCAAWVADRMMRGETVAIGDTHENGWVVDFDMMRHMTSYVMMLRGLGVPVETERFVRLNDHIAGTTDAWGVLRGDALTVIDLKYGYGIVEPEFNPQLSCYGGALVRESQRAGFAVHTVTLTICQPRASHPAGPTRSWTTDVRNFMGHVAEIKRKARRCFESNPIASAGPHCQDCPAAATCHALARSLYQAHGTMLLSQQRQMNREELASELVFLSEIEKMLKARKNMVEAEALAHIERGAAVPGWSIERSSGNRRWTVSANAVRALTGIDPTSDKMVTPAEMIRRGADEATVAALTETPRGKPTLTRFNANRAAQMFKGMSQ